MKKLLKVNIAIALLIIMFMGCDKGVDLIISYPFEIESTFRENTTINVGERTVFEIKPQEIVDVNEYQFRYNVTSGDGYYLDDKGEKLEKDTWYSLNELLFSFDFVGTVIGEVVVEAEVMDIERSNPITLKYIVESNNFSVELNTISTVATVNERKNFTLILSNTGEDQTVTYEASLFLSQGTGKIELFNEEGELVETVDQNETFDILPGTYNYAVTLDNDGNNVLSVKVTDSNGQKNEDDIKFQVNVIEFKFTGEPERNTVALGNDININFNIIETEGGNDTYEQRFVLVDGNAELYAGPTQVFAGVNTPVNLGAYSWIFRPTEIGKVELTFFARNTTGEEEEVTIRIEVIDRDFDFTATPTLNNLELGQKVGINYVITEVGGSQPDDYTMTYSGNRNGTLTINGITYTPGQVITIPSLSFFAEYEGLESGQHEISSTITAVSNNNPKTKKVSFEYIPSRFNFDVTTVTELTVGETIPVSFNINEISGESTFDISYSITGVAQELKNENGVVLQPNTDYDLNSNTFTWSLKAIQQGPMKITWTVRNQYGVEEPQTIDYTIKPIDFNFSVQPIGTRFKTREDIRFNFDMDAPPLLSYKLSFDTNGSGFVKYNGIDYQRGQSFTVTNTDFNLLGIFETPGQNIITWRIEASNGVVKEFPITIDIIRPPSVLSINTQFPTCSGKNCSCDNRTIITIEFQKDPSASLQSVTVINRQADGSVEYSRTENLSLQDSATSFIFDRCIRTTRRAGESLEITITDSLGQTSDIFFKNF